MTQAQPDPQIISGIPHPEPPPPAWETLPTMYDLPSENPWEPGLPDDFHILQPQLLSLSLRIGDRYADEVVYTGSDINLYYDVHHPLWYKRPDWFVATGASRLYRNGDLRLSYVVWQEGATPTVVVELLSPGTESEDLGPYSGRSQAEQKRDLAKSSGPTPSKWMVYEQILRIPYYIIYSRYTRQLRYFKLVGKRYVEQPVADQNPRVWIPELELGLGLWQGEFRQVDYQWLRWCDADGNWVPTAEEAAQTLASQETQRAIREAARATQEAARATREAARAAQAEAQLQVTARNLLAAGMSSTQIAKIMDLSELQVQQLLTDN